MTKTNVMDVIKKYTMFIVLISVVGFFYTMTKGNILLPQNVSNLIAQNAYVFVLATGMLLCILTGGNIDLSVGSVVCFVGAVGATLMETHDLHPVPAVIMMLLIGLGIGAWQGFLIAYVKVPPFIVTLAGMLIFRGLSNVVLNGLTVSLTNMGFINTFGGGKDCYIPDFVGNMMGLEKGSINATSIAFGIVFAIIYAVASILGYLQKVKKGYEEANTKKMLVIAARTVAIGALIIAFTVKIAQYRGIPTALVWAVLVIMVYAYITSKTTIGRHFYAVGGNEKATRLSGINTNRVYFIAYANMGFLAALAGMLTIARMTSAQPTYGQNYELDAIGSCFIGGASAYGGVGTVPGVIVGAILMGVINIGMSLMSVDQNWQKVVKGAVLLIAVIFDVMTKKAEK